MGRKAANLLGRRFGRFLVVAPAPIGRGSQTRWLCKCDCGTERVVFSTSLIASEREKRHVVYSCGCAHSGNRHYKWKGGIHISGTHWRQIQVHARNRKRKFKLTIAYVDELWSQQSGRCAITGMPLVIEHKFGGRRPRGVTASLDRIDNRLGYVPGNVQWVHKTINRMKHTLSQAEFVDLCAHVVDHCKGSDYRKLA